MCHITYMLYLNGLLACRFKPYFTNILSQSGQPFSDGFFSVVIIYSDYIPLLRYLIPSIIKRTTLGKAYAYMLDTALQMVQMRRETKSRLEVWVYALLYVSLVKGKWHMLLRLVVNITAVLCYQRVKHTFTIAVLGLHWELQGLMMNFSGS